MSWSPLRCLNATQLFLGRHLMAQSGLFVLVVDEHPLRLMRDYLVVVHLGKDGDDDQVTNGSAPSACKS